MQNGDDHGLLIPILGGLIVVVIALAVTWYLGIWSLPQ
jgi:hypothetical protein